MKERDEWEPKDALLGALFLVAGALIVALTYSAMKSGWSVRFWGAGWVIGPILLFLGGNAVFRALRARKRA